MYVARMIVNILYASKKMMFWFAAFNFFVSYNFFFFNKSIVCNLFLFHTLTFFKYTSTHFLKGKKELLQQLHAKQKVNQNIDLLLLSFAGQHKERPYKNLNYSYNSRFSKIFITFSNKSPN